jgi:endonuclease/exonuclease/phosphatase family metal-dependent hydrolase
MRRLFKKIFISILLVVNFLVIILFWMGNFSPYLDPVKWWFTGFVSLLFPYFAAAVLAFMILWLFIRPRWSLFSLVAILPALWNFRLLLPLNLPAEFNLEKKDTRDLRIMSWNIRYFTPFNNMYLEAGQKKQHNAILDEIKKYRPDIICFQEFSSSVNPNGPHPILALSKDQGYPYFYFSGDDFTWTTVTSGIAVFSKYPIVHAQLINYPEELNHDVEQTVMADIAVGKDTIRVYSMHLQSFGFLPRDYSTFRKIKNQDDAAIAASKSLLMRMRRTFLIHGLQADFMVSEFRKSPYPEIICTDLNDVPNSYAYKTIRGDRSDAFLEKGFGFGKTYITPRSRVMARMPTLRIDYIFTNPVFETSQVTLGISRLSDHRPVVADLRFRKKE